MAGKRGFGQGLAKDMEGFRQLSVLEFELQR